MTSVLAHIRRSAALLLMAVILALTAAPAAAGPAEDRIALDALFDKLRFAQDAASANKISQQIWEIWTRPSDENAALRMMDVLEARRFVSIKVALELADRLVEDYPDYAEGWNQRATLNFMKGDFEASLADIDKVLELEPRHFGALSGRVRIYLESGKRAEALRDMLAALAIHPFLGERQLFPELQDMTRT